MTDRDIIVIGTSAGGVRALQTLVASMPADLEAAMFVVMHVPADSPSRLAEILQSHTSLRVVVPDPSAPIEYGCVYLPAPDHHLRVDATHVHLTRGPKVNRFRPSVDVLFRSAAYAFGARVIGCVLTGALDDGTAGLWAVKQRGGTCVVQDPSDALHPSMPANAMRYVQVDHVVSLDAMPDLLTRLTAEPAHEERSRDSQTGNREHARCR